MTTLTFRVEYAPSPIGAIAIVTDDRDRLRALDFEDDAERMLRLLGLHYGPCSAVRIEDRAASSARCRLEDYLAGDLRAIDSLRVETGGTAFQRAVWAELRRIPAGQTISYAALAARIDRPKAVRAVGMANGANPVAIVVPCHRVIGANGSLIGYGGGLERKQWLLAHEGAEFPFPISAIPDRAAGGIAIRRGPERRQDS
ncbi:MAG TPA: methylated-DNA--[protein]-cysteine S-methyltransferase [Candidatus Binataceae bacterium]|nr:methylated-DNA--[protein]-cysteine S-methyltransferase [Candidatus Binataceae bacterium]